VGKNRQLGFVTPELTAGRMLLGGGCVSREPQLKIIQINNLEATELSLAKDNALKN
jgi:hypothetical protein